MWSFFFVFFAQSSKHEYTPKLVLSDFSSDDTCVCVCVGIFNYYFLCVCVFQDFYDEQGVFSESFWPQSEPPQAMAFNPRGRVNKPMTPPPTTQSINNQVGAPKNLYNLYYIVLTDTDT